MSSDDVAKAVALQKKLAASLMVRRDDLEAALKSNDSPELRAELATVQADLQTALDEIKSLKRLLDDAKVAGARAQINAMDDTDPFIRTPEELALDNVREHARSLEAQVKVGDELRRAEQPEPAPEKPSKEDADAQARAEFEALRSGGGKRPKTI